RVPRALPGRRRDTPPPIEGDSPGRPSIDRRSFSGTALDALLKRLHLANTRCAWRELARRRVLHDEDLAQAIVDRILERGRVLPLDEPSRRTKHLGLEDPTSSEALHQPARISGTHMP